jgi:hypothetical protein
MARKTAAFVGAEFMVKLFSCVIALDFVSSTDDIIVVQGARGPHHCRGRGVTRYSFDSRITRTGVERRWSARPTRSNKSNFLGGCQIGYLEFANTNFRDSGCLQELGYLLYFSCLQHRRNNNENTTVTGVRFFVNRLTTTSLIQKGRQEQPANCKHCWRYSHSEPTSSFIDAQQEFIHNSAIELLVSTRLLLSSN